jgi:hypothetical protein
MPLPLTEVDIRPWPRSKNGVVAEHKPTGLVSIRTLGTAAQNREAALRDLALIVAHRQEVTGA